MSQFLKHEVTTPKRKAAKKPQPQPEQQPVVVTGPPDPLAPFHAQRSIQHDINHIEGLSGIEVSLDALASAVRRITGDDHAVSLSTGYGMNPLKITLADDDYSDTMGRLVTAFERIADSVAKLAGLNRPRLESWHEQEEYEPRHKDIAVDGGAPGPAKTPAA